MRFPRRRHKALDERVAAARGEAELSRQRLESVREHVTRPLREAAGRNRFAEMIARSLMEGHR